MQRCRTDTKGAPRCKRSGQGRSIHLTCIELTLPCILQRLLLLFSPSAVVLESIKAFYMPISLSGKILYNSPM